MAPNPNARQAAEFVYQRLVSQGISPAYAQAAVGHLAEESGGFSPDVVAGKRRGDQGTAAFVAQWRGDRLQNLQNFARQQNRPLDLATQVDFIVHEGRAGLDQGAARWYREAVEGRGNLQDAVASFAHFERPQGYTSRNPYGIKTFDRRLQHAAAMSDMAGGAGPGVTADVPEYLRGAIGGPQGPGQVTQNTSAASNIGNYTPPSLNIDYGQYGIETPTIGASAGMSQAQLPNGAQYNRAFANDPYLQGEPW